MSPDRQPMPDLVVVIPGILGSVLELDGKEVWGLSGQAIVGNLLSLGRNIQRLRLPEGISDEEPGDGVKATNLLPDLHLLPGFWTIDGYGQLLEYLQAKFTLAEPSETQPGNLILFPYDWRLSNVVSAKRLETAVLPELERWRKHTGNPDAKLILICHSMGGLVARWFLEVLGGREITRQLITIATPYQGAIIALDKLVNGFSPGLGRLQLNLTELVRSFPSVYQLLPTYPCLDLGDGSLHSLTQTPVPDLDSNRVETAASFHSKIAGHVADSGSDYEIIAIKGIVQPTAQSALLSGGRIEPRNAYKGVDRGGDGRVPRPSSHPPEWTSDTNAVFHAQEHASLQNTKGVLGQLYGALTGQLGTWLGGVRIGVDIPDLTVAGASVPVLVAAEGDDPTLALQAVVSKEDGAAVGSPELLSNEGSGHYTTSLDELAPGTYRITVESAVASRPVDAVTNISLVWDPSASA